MKSKHNYSRRHFINQSCTAIIVAGITSVGCGGGKGGTGTNVGGTNNGGNNDGGVKLGTKIKRFAVDRKIIVGGDQITFTVELAQPTSKPTIVVFSSDKSNLLQMPLSLEISGTTGIVTRTVGSVSATSMVNVSVALDNERISHVITVVDGSKSRAFQPFPQAPQALNVRWFPGLISGGSFNLNSVTAGGAVIVSDNLIPIDISGDRTTLSVKENAASSQISQGREVDLNLAGRLFAVKGSLTSHIDTSSSQTTTEYSLTVDYRVSKGKAAVDMPKETFDRLQLKYLADPDGFESVYGTHYVSAVDRECYVRATYSVVVTSAESARKADLTIGTSGEWVAGSFSASRSVSERLKLLTSSSSININVETNAQNTVQANIISAPSEVDKVLDEISAIQTACNSATPVVSGYYLSKWSELFQQVGGDIDKHMSTRRSVTRDLIQRLRQKSLLTSIASEKAKFSHLGSLISYYVESLVKVSDEVNRLRSILVELNGSGFVGQYLPNDLGIEFNLITPVVSFRPHPQGNGSDVILQPDFNSPDWFSIHTIEFDFELVGVAVPNDLRFKIVRNSDQSDYYFADPVGSQKISISTGKQPSECKWKCRYKKTFNPDVINNYAYDPLYWQSGNSYGRSGTGWNLEIVNDRGLTVCSVPLPAR
jgi:hypothetical protein